MPSLVRGDPSHKHHFDGWTRATLAAHMIGSDSDHFATIYEPNIYQLIKRPLDELEELHTCLHRSGRD